jgi:hypothetical protein
MPPFGEFFREKLQGAGLILEIAVGISLEIEILGVAEMGLMRPFFDLPLFNN